MQNYCYLLFSCTQGLLFYLTEKGVTRTPIPKRLFDPEQDDEEPEGIDNEQFLSQLAGLHRWFACTQRMSPCLKPFLITFYLL